MTVERHPELVAAFAAAGDEICGHGYRWADYRHVDEAIECEHIQRTVAAIEAVTGSRPVGWYTGRTSANTRRLLVAEGGFLYDSDAYNDDLPYWVRVDDRAHLVVPYSFDTNDMRYVSPSGFGSGEDFVSHVTATFDQLYAEGADAPRMMSIGLHTRLAGRPGRARALTRVLEHIASHERVWFARRVDIARHWTQVHPPRMRILILNPNTTASMTERLVAVARSVAAPGTEVFGAQPSWGSAPSRGTRTASSLRPPRWTACGHCWPRGRPGRRPSTPGSATMAGRVWQRCCPGSWRPGFPSWPIPPTCGRRSTPPPPTCWRMVLTCCAWAALRWQGGPPRPRSAWGYRWWTVSPRA